MNQPYRRSIVVASLASVAYLSIAPIAEAVKIPIAGVSQSNDDSPLNGIRAISIQGSFVPVLRIRC